MGSHPVNLAIRFLLEVIALIAYGMWGWRATDNGWRWVLVLGLPVLMAALWATFAVPNDPSRSGEAPVVTPGAIRLLLELSFFAFAGWCLKDMSFSFASTLFLVVVVAHYLVSYDRIAWLLRQ